MITRKQTVKKYKVTAGVLDYGVPFPIYDRRDVLVVWSDDAEGLKEHTLGLVSDYSVTINSAGNGGMVTLRSGRVPLGATLAVVSNIPETQELDLSHTAEIDTASTERELDRQVQMIQQLSDTLSRCIKVGVTSGLTPEQLVEAIFKAYRDILDSLAHTGSITGAIPIVATGSSEPRPLKDRFADVINVKDFGAKGDGVTDDTEAIQKAMRAAFLRGGGEVKVPEGIYIISDTLIVPDNTILVGNGVGYEYYHPTTFLFKGTGHKRYALHGMSVFSIENPDVGAPYLEDSSDRGNIYKTLDLEASFSSAIILGKKSGIVSIAIIPNFNGISGYLNQTNRALSDSWDVGIWCRNADSWYLSKCASVGHWRKAALLITSSDIADQKIPSCEQGHAEFCRFQGFRGVAIRSPEPETEENYGFAGTDFINCLIKPLEHQGRCLATSSFITTPFDSPSASLEISGNIMRGIQFSMCTLLGRDDISIIAPNCSEIRFYGCYQESKDIIVNGSWLPLRGSRIIGGKNTNMQFYGCSKYAIDFSPYYTRESSVTRYPSSGGVLMQGGVVRDEEFIFPELGTTNGFRMVPNGVFRIYDSNFMEAYTLTQGGNIILSGDNISTKKSSLSIRRLYGSESEEFILRTYDSGNVEIFTDQLLVGGNLAPKQDGVNYCGMSARRWKEIYAATGSIITSDIREKQSIVDIPEAVLRAWGRVNFRQFLFNDAVQKKGSAARIHIGVIAQQVKEAFEAEGLDATRYGLLCYDEWSDEWDTVEIVNEPVLDEKGKEITSAQKHTERVQIHTAGNRYGIRYEEALALECAYQRWLGEKRESRIATLEAKAGIL